jgi:hypothetical protein
LGKNQHQLDPASKKEKTLFKPNVNDKTQERYNEFNKLFQGYLQACGVGDKEVWTFETVANYFDYVSKHKGTASLRSY